MAADGVLPTTTDLRQMRAGLEARLNETNPGTRAEQALREQIRLLGIVDRAVARATEAWRVWMREGGAENPSASLPVHVGEFHRVRGRLGARLASTGRGTREGQMLQEQLRLLDLAEYAWVRAMATWSELLAEMDVTFGLHPAAPWGIPARGRFDGPVISDRTGYRGRADRYGSPARLEAGPVFYEGDTWGAVAIAMMALSIPFLRSR